MPKQQPILYTNTIMKLTFHLLAAFLEEVVVAAAAEDEEVGPMEKVHRKKTQKNSKKL